MQSHEESVTMNQIKTPTILNTLEASEGSSSDPIPSTVSKVTLSWLSSLSPLRVSQYLCHLIVYLC